MPQGHAPLRPAGGRDRFSLALQIPAAVMLPLCQYASVISR